MDWKTLLASISGSVDEALLLRNAFLATANRILRDQIKGRVQLSDAERQTLAEISKKLGKKALEDVAHIVQLIPSWPGNGNSPLTNALAPASARRLDVPVLLKHWKIWSCRWPKNIGAGAMTVWLVPWRIWATPSAIRLSAISSSVGG